jgi:voltage-gated potassium channel
MAVLFLRKLYLKAVGVKNYILILFSILFVICSGFFIYFIEPERFGTPFNGIWYVMTTVTTVGYGDLFPETVKGKLFGMFLFIFGVGLIGVVIGKVVDKFASLERKREEGRLNYTGQNHVIIIGWSKKSEMAVDEILSYSHPPDIVVIDQLERLPLQNEKVFYVNGDPTSSETLHQANLHAARAAIVFADDRITDTSLIDGKSLLIVSTIEKTAPNVYTTVEIMLEKHITNFSHVQVNDFILSNETISRLAVRSALSVAMNNIFSQLLSRRHGDDMYEIKRQSQWKTYGDAFHDLIRQGATLIADRDNLGINRMLEQAIPADAVLYVICDEATYAKLLHAAVGVSKKGAGV